MAGHARQTTRLSPAAVPVHDDGDMQTGWFQEFHPSSQAARPRRVDSSQITLPYKVQAEKISGPGLALPRGSNQCLHVIQIPLQGSAARRRQAVLGLRQPPVKRFAARDVGRFFELARVYAQVAVGGLQQRLQLIEGERVIDRQRAHDPQPHPLVDQAVERRRYAFLRVAAYGAQPASAALLGAFLRQRAGFSHRTSFPQPGSQPPYLFAITRPKMICSAPKPTAINQLPQDAGENRARAPVNMKQSPITGTTRTEKAPPVTTAVPYSSSHIPGSTAAYPARKSATVSSAPTSNGGTKLSANFRPGPDSSGTLAARAFRAVAPAAMPTATKASASQGASHAFGFVRGEATNDAARPVHPTAKPPQPGTAVNEPARSMVSRMKRRLSAACASSATGSGRRERNGPAEDMLLGYAWRNRCQVLCKTKVRAARASHVRD